MAILAIGISIYPILYFVMESPFGILNEKSQDLLENAVWNIGFHGHISFGGIALLVGWLQFSKKIRNKYLDVHRKIGIVYVISVLISGICGFYIGIHATGGLVSQSGFVSLAIVWLATTIMGFRAAKRKDISLHEKMMIFSYAACFAAVTLRLWLPLLVTAFNGDFIPAYRIVAWLCWVPNMALAYFIVNK